MTLPGKVTRKRGRYYPLFVIGWRNYYHWNHDVIMRASRIMDHLPSDIKFVVPPKLKEFQYEALKRLLRELVQPPVSLSPDRRA